MNTSESNPLRPAGQDETRHTPAPWQVIESDKRRLFLCGGRPGYLFATTSDNGPEDYANARLMAAAPELLAACKALSRLAVMRECYCANLSTDYLAAHGSRCGVCLMRDAITKAEGGQS